MKFYDFAWYLFELALIAWFGSMFAWISIATLFGF